MTYHTLAKPCQAVYDIKKSEFLAFAYPITDKEQIAFHVKHLKERYPDARHHCLAYIIGDPKNTTHAGFDDDGEPNGTAGRPILNVLQHQGVGNVLVVVVRYFGGIKLGAGGLTRAYSTATQMVVDEMALTPFTPKSTLTITTSFADEAYVRHLVSQYVGEILDSQYGDGVLLQIQLDSAKLTEFGEKLGIYGMLVE
ncbi:MAG: YigZ family protein [Moraxella sp.]|nr:YigZ family protein [Moraxella sp.]